MYVKPALFTWCWQVTWRIQVFIALYRPHTSSVKLSENTAQDPKCSFELPAKAVGWVCSRLFCALELGRADHLPYLQSFLITFTYIKSGVIPPKQSLQACTAAVLCVKSMGSLWLTAQSMCIPAAAFGSAEGAELVGDGKWQRSTQHKCDICHALGMKCDRVITLQGTALPAALAAVTQILLPKHRCAGNSPGSNGEGFLVCTSQILLVLVWWGRMFYQPGSYGIAMGLGLCSSLCTVLCLCGTLSIHCIKALWSINLVLCH